MSVERPTSESLRRSPYTRLLLSLVLLLVIWPAVAQMEGGGLLRGLAHVAFFTLMLVAVLFTVKTGARRHIMLLLVIFAFLADLADSFVPGRFTTLVGQGASVFFLPFVIVFVVRRVFGPGRVTPDRLIAALCAYLFLGMFWASVYVILWKLDSAAFAFPDGADVHITDFTYFSFSTLTTLGYGDLRPVAPLARSLSFMEAVVGQLFIAVVLARLVALELVDARRSD